MIDTDAWRHLLTQKHAPNTCPCRKRHEAAPLPALPALPPGWNAKAARRYRDAIEELEAADDNGDEFAAGRARKKLAEQESLLANQDEIAAYKALVDVYRSRRDGWRNDVCGACGVSLMLPEARHGCARCMSEAELALVEVLEARP